MRCRMWWIALACGAPATVDAPPPEPPALAIPAPLVPLALPVGAGTLSQATDHLLEVDYPRDADRDALGHAWTEAFRAAGFSVGEPKTAPVATTWDVAPPGEHTWTLSVVQIHDRVEVHVNGLFKTVAH